MSLIKISDKEYIIKDNNKTTKGMNLSDLFIVANSLGIVPDELELAINEFDSKGDNIAHFGIYKRFLFTKRLSS